MQSTKQSLCSYTSVKSCYLGTVDNGSNNNEIAQAVKIGLVCFITSNHGLVFKCGIVS